MKSTKLFLPILIIVAALLSNIFAWSNSGGVLRPYIIFVFIMICPGLSLIRLINMKEFLTQWILAIALSLVLGVSISEFMVLTRLWSPNLELTILALISLIGAGLQIRKELSQRKMSEGVS